METDNRNKEQQYLSGYNIADYERPSVAADIALFTVFNEETGNYRKLAEKELRILLIKRKEHPFLSRWALPGGFMKRSETAEETASRELYEETGVKDIYLSQLKVISDKDRDPRGWIISTAFMALIDSTTLRISAASDAADAAWFGVSHRLVKEEKTFLSEGFRLTQVYEIGLSNEKDEIKASVMTTKICVGKHMSKSYQMMDTGSLAFDHAKIIGMSVDRLREETELGTIAFNLMPKRFTLTELQQTYEIILDKPQLAANFRRKIAKYVTETNDYTESAGHRPAKLFERNLENFV